MITYVNTVLVGTGVGTIQSSAIASATNGQYIVTDGNGTLLTSSTAAKAESIRVGLKTAKGVKWSNIIKKDDIKSYTYTEYADETEDAVTLDFSKAATAAAAAPVRVVVRLTFKDLPTKYRKWTESYEVEVAAGTAASAITDAFVAIAFVAVFLEDALLLFAFFVVAERLSANSLIVKYFSYCGSNHSSASSIIFKWFKAPNLFSKFSLPCLSKTLASFITP